MKINKIDFNGKKISIEVLDKIFSGKINKKLVDGILYKSIANYKGRKAKTKQKNEIIGSTSKIYAQKGTGNARHASRKAPIFVGGGIAHGPKGESNYKKRKLNKNEKKIGIASLISEKNKLNNLIIFNDFKTKISKTKEMSIFLKKFELVSALILLDKTSKGKDTHNRRFPPYSKGYSEAKGKTVVQKMLKGEKSDFESSKLSKREWNELMETFGFKEKIL